MAVHVSNLTPDATLQIPLADIEAAPPRLPPQPVALKSDDPFLVAFSPNFDALNPKDWPSRRKWAVTDVLSATGFNRIMVSTIMAPALSTIAHELHMSTAESVMALSIYLLASAFGPLVIGPLSEVYGREVILHASGVWFLVWNIACGFATSGRLLIGARFLAGFGASSIYALAGGVLSDVWRPEQRGRSLAIYLLIPLLGAAVGPIIGGFMAGRTTWRWMFWSTSIFQAVMLVVSFTAFRESYPPLILARQAAKLRAETGDSRYYTAHERAVAGKSVISVLQKALSRPIRLLIFHPVILITGIMSAFNYGILYIVLTSFAELWVKQYNFSVELSGLHYIACTVGEIVGSQIGAFAMDRYYRRKQAQQPDGEVAPEKRIPLILPGAFISGLGLFVYGWTVHYRVHWAVVDAAIVVVMFGMQTSGIALQAYTMDAYPDYTSSALAATQFLRSLTAFLFPLFVPIMYEAMGYGWGNSTLGFATLLLGFQGPFVLWYWGAGLRKRARSTY